MTVDDLGGDPACWAHLFDDDDAENRLRSDGVVVNLGDDVTGSGGAIWSLPRGGDLDANLVRLDGGGSIAQHANTEVDVLMFVQAGSGEMTIGDRVHQLGPDHLVLVPVNASRSIKAGPTGLTYLSVHRRRSRLAVKKRDPR